MPEDADDKEIKAAYRQAALAYHPDHIPKGVSKRIREDAAQAWLEIQEAFAVLGDSAKREEYDTLLEEMRQSEEAEQQFEPPAPPPAPPRPEPSPAPTPQQTTPQPTPQPQPGSSTESRSSWVWFCFQAGRHWRELCFAVAVALFVANGFRYSEAWSVMSLGIIFTSIMAAFFIAVASGPSRQDKRRYLVNAVTVIALLITGVTAMNIPTPTPSPRAAAIATSHPESPPPTNNTPSSSTARLVDVLKKHGFEGMPPACEKVPLEELDSCLLKAKTDFRKDDPNPAQEMGNSYLKTQKAMQASELDNSWLSQLPEEYLFACFETDRSRCSTSITHLEYQPNLNVLVETAEFQDYFPDTDKKLKPSPGRWHTVCALHPRKDGHWIGECTYTLLWPAKGKPDETACAVTTSEEITELTREGMVSGISGKIDWTPRQNPLNPVCPEDSGKKKEFHLVPKQ